MLIGSYPQLVIARNEEYVAESLQENTKSMAQHCEIVTYISGYDERVFAIALRRQLRQLPQIVPEIRVNVRYRKDAHSVLLEYLRVL